MHHPSSADVRHYPRMWRWCLSDIHLADAVIAGVADDQPPSGGIDGNAVRRPQLGTHRQPTVAGKSGHAGACTRGDDACSRVHFPDDVIVAFGDVQVAGYDRTGSRAACSAPHRRAARRPQRRLAGRCRRWSSCDASAGRAREYAGYRDRRTAACHRVQSPDRTGYSPDDPRVRVCRYQSGLTRTAQRRARAHARRCR